MVDLNLLSKEIQERNIHLKEDDVFNFLKMNTRWPKFYKSGQPSVEIISNYGQNKNFFFDDELVFDYNKWFKFYELGYTTIISNVLDLTEELREVRNLLNNTIGTKADGNFYFSRPGQKPSFEDHKHPYDVIVKQLYGKSKWKIDNITVDLYPQNTIIIPRNTLHSVIEKNEKKLSLTLNLF
jgi:mannose-6-phosphate isomerase-like protein (cupin superfamily)